MSYEFDPKTGFFVPSTKVSTITSEPKHVQSAQPSTAVVERKVRNVLPTIQMQTEPIKRSAAGKVWTDVSLQEWPTDDFRLFVGDLGRDCCDEHLIRAFAVYPSFQKAKVVKDNKSGRSKGYGFVSFADPRDGLQAFKEMNGKHIAGRPIKLTKSKWKERNKSNSTKK